MDAVRYLIRRRRRDGAVPRGYRHTLELFAADGQARLAACDLLGRPSGTALVVEDAAGAAWTMRPARRFLPLRWPVTGPDGQVVVQFAHRVLPKLLNPWYRTALSVLDGDGHERFRLVDPRSGLLERMFGLRPDDWVLLAGTAVVARLLRAPRSAAEQGDGRGVLRALLDGPAQAFAVVGNESPLPAPLVLCMRALLDELTDPSGG